MKRFHSLAALGALTAVLALGGLRAQDQKSPHEGHGAYEACARACADCTLQCESCFHHCAHLVAGGSKEHGRSAMLCNDCGDVCALAAKLTARQGPLAVTVCDACAKSCDTCAEACEKMPSDKHMAACAKSCRDCAKACREMVKHVGQGH
jgi:hypothetical protein